jgi:dTDP-4-dehydrorhamnose reductase
VNILVLGKTGQVAKHLQRWLPEAEFWSRAEADLDTPAKVGEAVGRFQPSLVVNAAAYTAVDKAESEPDRAWQVNAAAVAEIAAAAADSGAPIIHLSTDYVFDGRQAEPYLPQNPTHPINAYGRTKLAGELAAVTLNPRHWILRTSWVFSEFGSNFLKTILRLGEERDLLRVVDDQNGIPTFAGHVARAIGDLAAALEQSDSPAPGIYHLTGGKPTSWHGFALEVFDQAVGKGMLQKAPDLRPIGTNDYPTPAARPANSVLQPSAELTAALSFPIDWRAGLAEALEALQTPGPN